MDMMKTEYEFLDLSDVKEAELSSLQCALFERNLDTKSTTPNGWTDPTIDQSSCSSSTAGPTTVSSSLDSLSGGECEMAPHSPQRAGPPPYAQPPAYPPPQWPVAPPNVYVSQVTANVNVHGYMGQYYQPPQPQYVPQPPPQIERPPRNHRRDRRNKRVPSPPPPQHPPYFVPYSQYYPAAQAQGAPLYHLPMYQPLVYGPYAYPPYYPEYPMPVEGEAGDKGPDEYQQEIAMEQEAVEAYYAGAHYSNPAYGPPVDGGVEYMPPMYLQPTHHHAPMQMHHQQPHQSIPHQFNVHAKNFVQGQSHNKNYLQDKGMEPKVPAIASTSATASVSVESLPIKDLKIGKGPGSPIQERPADNVTKPISLADKTSCTLKIDPTKPSWNSESKQQEGSQIQIAAKTFPTATPTHLHAASAKVPPITNKALKGPGPTAPFSTGKQPSKPTVPTAVSIQHSMTTPKAPFGNRQRREGPTNRSPSNDIIDIEKSSPVEHIKREPPLPPSKAPMPISITLHSQGPPVIITNKSPFGHSRKMNPIPEPPPTPQPPPPAPTASDFPPPPTPRNRGESLPPPVILPQPQPAPGKSWASLFSNKNNITSTPPPLPVEDPPSPTTLIPPVAPNIQKPVAKVPPFDASPSQTMQIEKTSPSPKPTTTTTPTLSYSEKTSVNAVSNVSTPTPPAKACTPTATEIRDVPIVKESPPVVPAQSSPFCDDPNSYRMGEFLSKYQLDNRPVTLLPRGLTNRSNYCYVNAILQALIACPPFYNLLKALPYQVRRGKSGTPVIDSMVELCYEFSPVASAVAPAGGAGAARRARGEAAGGAGPALDGAAGQRVLRALRPFPGSEGRQEDAEEFLGCLLNSLNDEMLELIKLVEPEEPKDTNGRPNGIIAQEPPIEEEDDDDEWKVMGPRNRGAVERRWAARRTPVGDIFRGRTRLRLHRAAAPHPHHDVTDAVQPFFTLQLDIERSNTVKDALELLAGKDTLEGVSDAWQQLSLEQLPVVLLLHLKCFQLDSEGHTAKIVKNIDFPIDLKIDPKIMSSKHTTKQRLYKLFAVVYHEGVEAVKGHYVTDTFHGQSGWIRYDDSTVTQVAEAQVLKPKPPRMPYLLMYRRHDTLPPHRVPGKPE